MTPEEQNAQMLQDYLNGREMTDEEGNLTENDNSVEESAPQEQTTDTDTATAEKSAESEDTTPKVGEDDSETELAEDESGKKYIPKSRFDKVYGKQKQLEREIEQLRSQQATKPSTQDLANLFPQVPEYQPQPQDLSTNAVLEQEILLDKYPQFNPESPEYNQALDRLGGEIARTMPAGTSRIAIAKRTLEVAKELTAKQAEVVAQSRQVKLAQADQGVTSRVNQRVAVQPDFNSMSLEDKEQYLKEIGEWDRFQ